MHMQISYKPVVQACDDFEIWKHTSEGEQINFKFLFNQFGLVRYNWAKYSRHTTTVSRNFHNLFLGLAFLEQAPSWANKTRFVPMIP